MSRGKYIVIEGPTYAGKTTHLAELAKRLEAAGVPVRTFESYGTYGDARKDISSYPAESAQTLRDITSCLDSGVTCLTDHSFLSPLVYQYYGFGSIQDYDAANRAVAPLATSLQPDLCIVLDAPVSTLLERAHKQHKDNRNEYLEPAFLERVRAGYLWEAKERGYQAVFTTDSIDRTADNIWEKMSAISFTDNQEDESKPESVGAIIKQRYGTPASGKIAPAQQGELAGGTSGNMYIIAGELPEQAVNAALEMFAQTARDLRTDIIPAVLSDTTQAEGATSGARHLVIEGISDLAARYIMQLSGAHCRVQPYSEATQYVAPDAFGEATKKLFNDGLRQIAAMRSSLKEDLTSYLRKQQADVSDDSLHKQIDQALIGLHPVAIKANICISAPATVLRTAAAGLLTCDLAEARSVGQAMAEQVAELAPSSEAVDAGHRTNAKEPRIASLNKLAEQFLPSNHTTEADPVKLLSYAPRNELDLVPAMLYPYSDQPALAIQREVERWAYSTKADVVEAYLASHNYTALDRARYDWELVSDYSVFRELEQSPDLTGISWQALTPRHGYDIPQLIDDAGLTDEYEQCFERSLSLYSHLQAAGYASDAQYATLFGHRVRWQCSHSASGALNFFAQNRYGVVQAMREQLASVHPHIGDSLHS